MRTSAIVVSVVAFLVSVAPIVADQAKDEAAIRNLFDQAMAAWNQGDGKAYAATWHSDGRHRGLTTGGVIEGGPEFEKAWSEYLAEGGLYFGTRASFDVTAIRFITPEIAAVDANMEVTGFRSSEGNPPSSEKMRGGFVVTKKAGRWAVMASWAAAAGEETQE